MRILVISHSYFPANEPRAFRWTCVSEMFVKLGHKVDVITSSNEKSYIGFSRRNGVRIIKIYDIFFSSTSREVIKSKNKEKSKNKKRILNIVFRKILQFIRWPDYAWFWIFPSILFGRKLLNKYNYNLVFSVSNPFSSHIVAYFLLKNIKSVNWVVDYGDPFSFEFLYPSNNLLLFKKLNFDIESRILKKSKKISVTNENVISKFNEYFNIKNIHYEVIPPFVNLSSELNIEYNPVFNNDVNTINLVYSGVLYSKLRNPEFLLRMINKINNLCFGKKIVIHFFGDIGDCKFVFDEYLSGLNNWLFIHGSIPKENLQFQLKNANILVNIGNNNIHQLPSKIFEYISFELPILNIVYSNDDLTLPLLKDYNSSLSLICNLDLSFDNLFLVYEFLCKPHPINYDFLNKIKTLYSLNNIAINYLKFIN